jgi:hypothetical protein
MKWCKRPHHQPQASLQLGSTYTESGISCMPAHLIYKQLIQCFELPSTLEESRVATCIPLNRSTMGSWGPSRYSRGSDRKPWPQRSTASQQRCPASQSSTLQPYRLAFLRAEPPLLPLPDFPFRFVPGFSSSPGSASGCWASSVPGRGVLAILASTACTVPVMFDRKKKLSTSRLSPVNSPTINLKLSTLNQPTSATHPPTQPTNPKRPCHILLPQDHYNLPSQMRQIRLDTTTWIQDRMEQG